MEQGAKNTDKEIWRKVSGDYYSPSIHVTEHGDIGIAVGGAVLVAPVERWYAAGEAAFCVNEGRCGHQTGWDSIVYGYQLTIEEEQDFEKFCQKKGVSKDATSEQLIATFAEWTIEK